MGIFDIFSKRQRRLRGDAPDVFDYDCIPRQLRVQIVHIWTDAIGRPDAFEHYERRGVIAAYRAVVDILCREYGVFTLPGTEDYGARDYFEELVNFVLKEENVERVLDAVELSFRAIDNMTRNVDYLNRRNYDKIADSAIEELNGRFREHGVGYEWRNGLIIRVDSKFIHKEAVKPALSLLHDGRYAGAEAEFLQAHEHYRHGRHKEALNECLKAFESVMKEICGKRKWKHPPKATANQLIETCLDN